MELTSKEGAIRILDKITNGQKYNWIDMFFEYKIKRENLYKKINLVKFSEENIKLNYTNFSELNQNENLIEIDKTINLLIGKIKSEFGVDDFNFYKKKGKSRIINNPKLLGISPYLFNIEDFKNFLCLDLSNSKIEFSSRDDFIYFFEKTLNDTLQQLKSDAFLFYNIESVKEDDEIFLYKTDDIINLFYEKNYSIWNDVATNKKSEKKLERIVLQNYNTSYVIDTLTGSFKGAKALNEQQKMEIRKFVSMIFVNRGGKRMIYNEILDIIFISSNIKHLTEILKSEKKFKLKSWSNKKLSELICNISPDHFKLKTIENY